MIQRNGSASWKSSGNHWRWTGKRMKKHAGLFKRVLGQHKHTNTCIIEVLEGGERKGWEHVLKMVAEQFPNLKRRQVSKSKKHRELLNTRSEDTKIWPLKWQRLNIEKLLKAAREKKKEKKVIYKGYGWIFSRNSCRTERSGMIFTMMKRNTYCWEYSARFSFLLQGRMTPY